MKLNHYYKGILSAAKDCQNYGDMDFDAPYLASALPDDLPESSRLYQLGERAALRAFRDLGADEAIDLISARLWKWGAQEELDQFLETVGVKDNEPVPLQDRPALRDCLSRLYYLDRNGWATVTDGTLDYASDEVALDIITHAITEIHEMNEDSGWHPCPVAYEKLSGEIVLDYSEGGAL